MRWVIASLDPSLTIIIMLFFPQHTIWGLPICNPTGHIALYPSYLGFYRRWILRLVSYLTLLLKTVFFFQCLLMPIFIYTYKLALIMIAYKTRTIFQRFFLILIIIMCLRICALNYRWQHRSEHGDWLSWLGGRNNVNCLMWVLGTKLNTL